MENSTGNNQNFSHSAINLIKSNPVSNISKFLIDSILNASSPNNQQNLAFFSQFQNNLNQEFLLNGGATGNCAQFNPSDFNHTSKNSWNSNSGISCSEDDQRLETDSKKPYFQNSQRTDITSPDFSNLPFGNAGLNTIFNESRNEFGETNSNLRCHQVSSSSTNQIESSDDVSKFQHQMMSHFGNDSTSCLIENSKNSTNNEAFANVNSSTGTNQQGQTSRPLSDPLTSVQNSLNPSGAMSTPNATSLANLSLVSYLQQASVLNPLLVNQSSQFTGLQSVHAAMAAENYSRLLAMAAEQNQG